MTNKTFLIVKRGRKYFDCVLSGKKDYKAKLVINAISTSFEVGATIEVLVNDLSKHSRYGSSLTFEPTTEEAKRAAARANDRYAVEAKWLGYAETDAGSGEVSSNAIRKTLDSCHDPRLKERLEALKDCIASNASRSERAVEKVNRKAERPAGDGPRSSAPYTRLLTASQSPTFDVPTREGSSVVVYTGQGESVRISDDHASIYGSHLCGCEGEWACFYEYRLATDQEVEALAESEKVAAATRKAISERSAEISRIRDLIRRGECPHGIHDVSGDRLFDTFDGHGYGEMYVITPDAIWHLRNNRSEGDTWARSNVAVGGGSADAIGWWVPRDANLEARLRALTLPRAGS